jgi:hypothetical protein
MKGLRGIKGKLLRAVLRGLGGSNTPRLPGEGDSNVPDLPDTFAWLARYRRRSRDYEHFTDNSERMVYWASINRLIHRLAPAVYFQNSL